MNLDFSCVFEGLGSHGALYISNSKTATNFFLLEKLNIKAVVTAAKGNKIDLNKSKIQKYLYLEIEDYEDFGIQKYFDEAFGFIESARKVSNVLVHSNNGANRSVTIVMAYLIRKYSYSVSQIYSILKLKRKQISPNHGFIKQLQNYSQMYSVRNTEFPTFKPKPKIKIQRSVSFETAIKAHNFDLSSNSRLIKSEDLKEKIERLGKHKDLFKEDQQKIEELYMQRQSIEERLKILRNGLIKSYGTERKKRLVGGQENQNPNVPEDFIENKQNSKEKMLGRSGFKNMKISSFSSPKEQFAHNKDKFTSLKQK